MSLTEKIEKHLRRKKRVRSKVHGTKLRPRLSVFRSNRHLFVQLIDDVAGRTLVSASDSEIKDAKTGDVERKSLSGLVGELIAKKAGAAKIKKAVFDKNGYRYHGKVKDIAEGARRGGLEL